MNYAKVENGQVIQVGLPTTGILKDGSTVSGYNLLPEDILREEGWLPLIDNPPEYDPETQYLEHAGYIVGETEVTVNYIIKQKEIQIVDDLVDDEIVAIAEAIVDLDARLSALEGGM
jgi:hypothetical protein